MDLKVGEVSEVITDPNGSHYVYKLVSKETLPLESREDRRFARQFPASAIAKPCRLFRAMLS